jgi:hypothetical protein
LSPSRGCQYIIYFNVFYFSLNCLLGPIACLLFMGNIRHPMTHSTMTKCRCRNRRCLLLNMISDVWDTVRISLHIGFSLVFMGLSGIMLIYEKFGYDSVRQARTSAYESDKNLWTKSTEKGRW